MNSIVGFIISDGLTTTQNRCVNSTTRRSLQYFPWLNHLSLKLGDAELDLWGHGKLEDLIHRLPDGASLVLIGSPVGDVPWPKVEKRLAQASCAEIFELPWNGRVILLKISADGQCWTTWNDWCGSIPVFHAQVGHGRIASTIEPVVVAAAGYTPNDFFLPGLVSLLINGHYLGDWTLFKDMRVVPPDCVAEWDNDGFRWKRLWTVKPSDERWDRGWEELVDEMYELSHQSIAEVLKTQPSWILPLSGGLDSRLIAAVGAEMGVDLHAYTYGHANWAETIYARQVARKLELPWQRVPIGPDYLVRYTRMWLEWFGSALHCHGMYQMPFLGSLKSKSPGPILQGYMGDPLAGNHLKGLIAAHINTNGRAQLAKSWVHWTADQVRALSKFPVDKALEQVTAQIESEINAIESAWFQCLMFLDFWNRQRLFIYYHPMMYDYWRGVGTPFFNREYARFCLSLPRLALEDRVLQKEMLRRYYPKMAAIGSTFGGPLIQTKSYLVKGAIAWALPRFMRKGPLQEFAPTGNTIQINALRASGEEVLWPLNLNHVRRSLYDWFKQDVLEQTYRQAAAGDETAYNRLRPIQAIAWHSVRDGA